MKEIPVTQKDFILFALVDDWNYDRLMQHKWHPMKGQKTWYATRRENGKHIYMHREILNPPKGIETDHRNGNGLDNQENNLRIATHSQNIMNSVHKLGKTGYRGIWYNPNQTGKKYIRAAIRVNNITINLGNFKTEIDAAKAYDSAALLYFGEFARTNFKQDDKI